MLSKIAKGFVLATALSTAQVGAQEVPALPNFMALSMKIDEQAATIQKSLAMLNDKIHDHEEAKALGLLKPGIIDLGLESAVANVQASLNKYTALLPEPYLEPLEVDGILGKKTAEAIIAFSSTQGFFDPFKKYTFERDSMYSISNSLDFLGQALKAQAPKAFEEARSEIHVRSATSDFILCTAAQQEDVYADEVIKREIARTLSNQNYATPIIPPACTAGIKDLSAEHKSAAYLSILNGMIGRMPQDTTDKSGCVRYRVSITGHSCLEQKI